MSGVRNCDRRRQRRQPHAAPPVAARDRRHGDRRRRPVDVGGQRPGSSLGTIGRRRRWQSRWCRGRRRWSSRSSWSSVVGVAVGGASAARRPSVGRRSAGGRGGGDRRRVGRGAAPSSSADVDRRGRSGRGSGPGVVGSVVVLPRRRAGDEASAAPARAEHERAGGQERESASHRRLSARPAERSVVRDHDGDRHPAPLRRRTGPSRGSSR